MSKTNGKIRLKCLYLGSITIRSNERMNKQDHQLGQMSPIAVTYLPMYSFLALRFCVSLSPFLYLTSSCDFLSTLTSFINMGIVLCSWSRERDDSNLKENKNIDFIAISALRE